jgi:hypothetical protein
MYALFPTAKVLFLSTNFIHLSVIITLTFEGKKQQIHKRL